MFSLNWYLVCGFNRGTNSFNSVGKNLSRNVIEVKYRVNDFDKSSLPNEFKIETCVADTLATIQKLLHK